MFTRVLTPKKYFRGKEGEVLVLPSPQDLPLKTRKDPFQFISLLSPPPPQPPVLLKQFVVVLFSREASSLPITWVADTFPTLWPPFQAPSLSLKNKRLVIQIQFNFPVQFFHWGMFAASCLKFLFLPLGHKHILYYFLKDPIVLPFKVRIRCHPGLIVV